MRGVGINGLVAPGVALLLAGPMAVRTPATTYHINQSGFSFSPSSLTIMAGDTVVWHWTGGSHTVTTGDPCSPNGIIDELLNSSNPTVTYTFVNPGVFPYFCRPHCGFNMRGTITVNAPAGCATCPGDMDGNNLKDGHDVRLFISCFIGGNPGASGCACSDMNNTGAYESADITLFVDTLLNDPDGVCP